MKQKDLTVEEQRRIMAQAIKGRVDHQRETGDQEEPAD